MYLLCTWRGVAADDLHHSRQMPGTQYYEVHARYIVKAEVSAVGQYWRRALIRIVRYSLVWGCDDGQPDLPGGGHVVLLGSGQLDYLVSQWPLMEART